MGAVWFRRRERRDDHKREGIDDGESGGGDAAEGAVELQRGLGGAQFPHPQRLLLQAKRSLQLLRRRSSEGGSQQGPRAFLPNGRPPPPRRGRARGA